MRTHMLASCAFALAAVCAEATAQATDFSGKWTSEPIASDSAGRGGRGGRGAQTGDMGSGWGPNITITQDANQIVVEYAFFARGDLQPPLRFTYALDGAETKNSVLMGHGVQTTTSKAAWQEGKLVIATTYPFVNPQNGQPATTTVTRTLTLESPTSLVVETVYGGVLGGPETRARTVYRKAR